MFRAFTGNAQFNAMHREPIDVPLFLAAGDASSFAKLLPQIAHGLRANGCTHVETGLIPHSVHYVVADQPEAVADLIDRYASLHFK
jgi:pimeloyl-ACP methyl ester carboxylesterase